MDAHSLLRLVPERLDPRAAAVHQHLGIDLHAVDRGAADLDVGAVADEQHTIQLHRRAGLDGEAVDQDAVSWRYAVLLSSAEDDGRQQCIRLGHERLYYRTKRSDRYGRAADGGAQPTAPNPARPGS